MSLAPLGSVGLALRMTKRALLTTSERRWGPCSTVQPSPCLGRRPSGRRGQTPAGRPARRDGRDVAKRCGDEPGAARIIVAGSQRIPRVRLVTPRDQMTVRSAHLRRARAVPHDVNVCHVPGLSQPPRISQLRDAHGSACRGQTDVGLVLGAGGDHDRKIGYARQPWRLRPTSVRTRGSRCLSWTLL